jgi:hypothetical protein
MSDRAPYSRVYWTIRADDRLAGIYPDNHHLATWLRLLIAADMAWPAPADVPSTARKASVEYLAEAGVIELLAGGLFRFHGLDAERGRRRDAARRGPDGSPDGTQLGPKREADETQMPPRARPPLGSARLSSSSSTEGGVGETTEDDAAVALHARSGTFPSSKVVTWLNEIADRHGESRLTAAIRVTPMDGRTVPDYIRAVVDGLRAQDHAAERAEAVAEKERNAEKRRPPVFARPVEDVSPEEADRIAREFKAEAKGRLS